MSSHVFHDHEDALRAALSAAADGIEPSGDGLQRIQSRLCRPPRPLPVAWAQELWTRLSLRIPERAWYALDRAVHAARTASERLLPEPDGRRPGRGGRLAWLRPVSAMGVGVAVIAAVVYISINVTQVISPASSTGASTRAGGPAASVSAGGGSAQTQTHSHGAVLPGVGPTPQQGAPTTSPACLTAPIGSSASPTTSPSTATSSPSQSVSPSQSASASASASVTPTPTPTPSASSTPTDATTTPAVATNPATNAGLAPAATAGTSAALSQAGASSKHAVDAAASTSKADGRRSQADSAGIPCQSKSASPKPTKSPKVSINPDAGGMMLLPAAARSQAAEVRAKLLS
jgi:hypothetical protein